MSEEKSYTRVAQADTLTNEASLAVDVNGTPVLVCRSKGQLFAVINRCSHADEKLQCGRVRAGWIACPIHGARFDLATGRAMNPPATRRIETYAAREADGWIEVAV